MLRAAAREHPGVPAIRYFDGVLDYGALWKLCRQLALTLRERGVRPGDRVAIISQNIPQLPIGVAACWLLGAIPMPCNPMYSHRELVDLFTDAAPRLVICETSLCAVVKTAMETVGLTERSLLTTSASLYQTRDDFRVLSASDGAESFPAAPMSLASEQRVDAEALSPEDPGLLLYTSGTTGRPKGAVLSHRALAYNAATSNIWFELGPSPTILGLAPLFHITGFVCHLCAALLTHGTLVLTYRFKPDVVLDAIRECRPTFTIGAITAFNALMNAPGFDAGSLSSFRTLYSGGAPISPALVAQFLARSGCRILPAYGMTETCAPTHIAPAELDTPVDPKSGAYAIGIPTSDVEARLVDDDGNEVPAGVAGELLLRGPQLMSGYWSGAPETRATVSDEWLRTGDVAVMDERGWFYIVDRKKDVIIASGFKVWPREIEDVIYRYPGVREVAVIGVPDDYRGETVKACVSVSSGIAVDPTLLIAFCRERLAAYKVPRIVEVLAELPKTATGKIMRAELRSQNSGVRRS
jgi:long-chain acyl-CoA synthetase